MPPAEVNLTAEAVPLASLGVKSICAPPPEIEDVLTEYNVF